MSLFNTHILQVKRYENGQYVMGKWVEGTQCFPMTIKCSWQPLNGEEQQTLPEGLREKVAYKGFTASKLRTSDPEKQITTEQLPKDVIIGPDGYDYDVIKVERHQNMVLPHYSFIAVRIKEGN